MRTNVLTGILAVVVSLFFVTAVMAQQQKPVQNPATTQESKSPAATPQESKSPAATTQESKSPAVPPQESKLEKFSGVVEKVDSGTKDVLVQFHKEKMTFSLTDKTKIMEGKKELPFSDLKKGMWASVEYMKEGDKLMASMVSVSPPKEMMKKEVSAPPEVKKENPSEKVPQKAPETK
jgi:biopolymer transport protein ExbD